MRRINDEYWDEERHQLYNIMSQRLIVCWTLIGFMVLVMLYVNLDRPDAFINMTYSYGCLVFVLAIIPASLMLHYMDSIFLSSLEKMDGLECFRKVYDLNAKTKACFHTTICIIVGGASLIAASSKYMADEVAMICTIISVMSAAVMLIVIPITLSGKSLKKFIRDLLMERYVI